jgi:phosphoglycerate dehydrogenase-like enzyme
MTFNVLCLRPEDDFLRVGITPPAGLTIAYRGPGDIDVPALVTDAQALVIPAVGPKLPADLFQASAVKLVQVTGAGFDRLDADAMKRLGIPVANVPGATNQALAEYATATALTLLRRLAWADAELKAGRYVSHRQKMVDAYLQGLEGLTVGVLGLGQIGLHVARAFHFMGGKIVYFDPAPRDPDGARAIGAVPLSLNDLLAVADVITLHVPLIPATQNLIGRAELARMKKGAVLINAARGGVVDEGALAASLTAGHLGAAAVDVYAEEPPPADNPLFKLTGEPANRLLLTPHIAGVSKQSWAKLFRDSWKNVERVLLKGEAPLNRVY